MKAKADPEFWRHYNELPARVQELAQKNYALWLANPFHPSLQFKEIGKNQWSARVGSLAEYFCLGLDWHARGIQ